MTRSNGNGTWTRWVIGILIVSFIGLLTFWGGVVMGQISVNRELIRENDKSIAKLESHIEELHLIQSDIRQIQIDVAKIKIELKIKDTQ